MKKYIFTRFFVLISLALIISTTISSITLNNNMKKKTQQDMLRLLKVIAHNYDSHNNASEFVKDNIPILKDTRLTIISPLGQVLADSHSDASKWKIIKIEKRSALLCKTVTELAIEIQKL